MGVCYGWLCVVVISVYSLSFWLIIVLFLWVGLSFSSDFFGSGCVMLRLVQASPGCSMLWFQSALGLPVAVLVLWCLGFLLSHLMLGFSSCLLIKSAEWF